MRHQATEKIGPMVNTAIDKHGQGEEILWEPQLLPGRNGEAMLVCFFWMPGAVLGSTMQGSFQILDPIRITAAEIEETVEDFLSQMRAARAQQAEVDPEEGAMGERFGRVPPPPVRGTQRPSGLLIP